MSYQYCQRNRLEEPHAYMYTPFEGEALLVSYRDNRMAALREFSCAADSGNPFDRAVAAYAAGPLARLLAGRDPAIAERFRDLAGLGESSPTKRGPPPESAPLPSLTTKAPVDTSTLLQALIAAQLTGVDGVSEKAWLDRLVQRFEVSKKLHERYLPGFRKGDGGNTTLRLYWLFGLALALAFLASDNLKYMSALLKLSDLLCSLPGELVCSQVPASGVKLLLAAEAACVGMIAQRSEVAFALG